MAHVGGIWILCEDIRDDVVSCLNSENASVPIYLKNKSISAGTSILSLISLSKGTIDYISVATASNRGSSIERKVIFGPAIQIEPAIDMDKLLEGLPNKFKKNVNPPSMRTKVVPPKSWDELVERICRTGAIRKDDVDHLNSVIESRKVSSKLEVDKTVKLERDAIAMSLETFKGSALRKKTLNNSTTVGDAPFIKSLYESGVAVLEDRMIDNDLSYFPGANAIKRHIVGAVRVETDTESLTLVNANRTSIEHTLGVDLVYYHHAFDSFTLVQYKRLTGEHEPTYYPDSDASYARELSRMLEFCKGIKPEKPPGLSNFRFTSNPFFFKFCLAKQDSHWSRMLPGMYFPLELWQEFIGDDSSKGPKGGLVVSYENAMRRLNNTQFVQLLRGGWIGSIGLDSTKINAVLEQELSADKSIIAAIHHERKAEEDYLRDARGRFASEGDLEV